MTMEGKGGKELPDKDEVTGNKLVHEGINVNKDSEFKTGTVNDVVKRGGVGTLESKGSQLLQPEQSQEAAICWERFLHVTSIKVLLVENDDSTRHVVTALLRNCNYEVIEAANGWQAWKILENLTNQVDLVLSEVAMPCLSGIGLLCKIMSHKTRKNIPVIMTSSHDSVGLVFKCLSKGAADFLLKPVRKNELKNLWQHVWRRCLSSSGSGSGTQSQKSVKSKGSQRSENASGRNDEEYNQGNASPGNGSDDGNGMQSSSKKQAVEVDISQAVSPCDQTPEPADSICGQVLSANAETSARRSAHMNPSRECLEEEPDDTGKGKTSITSSVRDPELEPENAVEVPLKHCGARHKIALEIEETPTDNSPPSDHHVVTAAISHDRGELNKVADALEINNTSTNESKHHVIELSLKRLRGLRESGMTFQDDRNVLRRSEHSAFSRYSSASNLTRTPQGITQRNSLIEDSMEIAKIEPVHDIEAHMNKKLVNSMSNGVNNIITMDSTTNILVSKPLALRDTINSLQLLSAFKPVTSDCLNSSEQTVKVEPGDIQTTDALAPQNSHDNVVIQHHHHHHNHHHYHNLNQNCTSNHDDLSLKQVDVDGPHCASSNVLASFCEGNPKHHSLNRSASGSIHGSNEQSGSSNTVNAGGSNGNSDTGIAGTSRSTGDASGSGSGNRMDHFKLVRAAALTKFRQKRKERCFMKKVRYQNRQRLAEQRPRVRGQFVRHTDQNNLSNSADG